MINISQFRFQGKAIHFFALFSLFCFHVSTVLGQTPLATTSTVTANPPVIPSNGTTTITVQLRDVNGTKITSSGGAIVSFLSPSAGSISSVTDNSNGTYTAIYTATGVSSGTNVILTPRLSGTNFTNTVTVSVSTQFFFDGTTGNGSSNHAVSTTGNITIGQGLFANYLIVGGGGGGSAGGGGAGGFLTNMGGTPLRLSAQLYTVSVGAGGAGTHPIPASGGRNGHNGSASTAFGLTANGGGGGGWGTNAGSSGASGGGSGVVFTGSSASASQGNAGGISNVTWYGASGGGGGAGSAGSNATTQQTNTGRGGNGGSGRQSSITGTSLWYAAGGGGGAFVEAITTTDGGIGGNSIGGNGGRAKNSNGTAASPANRGSGGGGAEYGGTTGGNGSSGVVIVNYPGSALGSVGGTITSYTGNGLNGEDGITYQVHSFTIEGGDDFNLTRVDLPARLKTTITSNITGTGNLTYNGPGELILTGTNSYSGTTTISAGTLVVNGVHSGTGAVTVASGAALKGTGTLTGATTIQTGGTLQPGNSIGTINLSGGLTFESGGNLNLQLNNAVGTPGNQWSLTNVTGALTINATTANPYNINLWSLLADGNNGVLANFNPTQSSYSWTIITTTAGVTNFDAAKFRININARNGTGGLQASYNADNFRVEYDAASKSIQLVYTPPSLQTIDGTNNGSETVSFSTNTTAGALTLNLGFFADYLIVGAGGGGAGNKGGGGGGGGFSSGTVQLSSTNYTVTVGAGGAAGTDAGSGGNGGSSSVFGLTASGGIGGTAGSWVGGASGDGISGGAGTGATHFTGGGGGGAASAGFAATSTAGGSGGAGRTSSISGGSLTSYGGGGGGGSSTGSGSAGGSGGGGAGGSTGFAGAAASANTGGGGGGGGGTPAGVNNPGGAGGSGVVIIRYEGASLGSIGGTETTFTGNGTIGENGVAYRVHTFTSSGNFNLSGVNINNRLRATLSGNITGTGNLIYSGPGILSLTGTGHTYTGSTSITTGELRVNSSITTSSGVTVSSGAKLSGTGTLPATTVSGTHAPGTSPGLQTLSGNLTYNAGSSIDWELISNAIGTRGTDYDGIDVTGDLNFSGATTLNLLFNSTGSAVDWSNDFWRNSQTGTGGWKLFEVTGTITGLSNVTVTLSSAATDKDGDILSTSRSGGTQTFSLVQVGTGVYINYTITPSNITWTGTTSTNWSTTTNWSPNGTPATDNHIIIGTSSNPPMFTGTSNYRQLTVNAGATLNLAAASTMSINGDLTNNGMVSGDGTLQLNGTSTQNLTGTGTVHNLKVNNSAGGVTIASGSNKVYVTGVFTPTSGVTITNGNLVFRSTASQEGTVGVPGTCPTEPITGDVTVEKYLPGKRAFRLLSPGVTTTTPINTHWQEGSAVTTTTGYPFTTTGTENPAPGYGTHITGTGGSTNGFDATVTNNASLFTYNPVSAAWVAEANTNAVGNVLRSGEGYRILLRGSRGVDLNNNTATADATTLRTTGTLEVCATRTFTTSSTVPLSAASAGFSLVGNPYWSVVDWHTVSATNLEQTIYYWDPNLAGTSNRGAYVSYNTSSGKSNPSSNITRYIQPGQAFFVRNTAGVDGSATLPTLTIDKDDIVTGTGNRSSIFGRAPRGELVPGGINMTPSTTERIYVSLIPKGRTVSGTADGLLVAYGKTFGMEKGKEDAEKLTNPDENLSADYGGLRHSILGLPMSEDRTDSIPLGLWNLSAGNYTLRIDLEDLAPGREVWIYDRQTKRTVRVTGSGEVYGFTIEGNAAKRDGLVLVVHGRAPLVSQTGGLVLYPNPLSGDRLQVALPSASIETTGGEADWELLNGQGVTVQRGTMVVDGSGRGVMELWGVAGGVYVVRIRTTSGAVFTSKLIKP